VPYNVLIVDDSNFFQTRLRDIVNEHPELKTVAVAANGQEAIDMAAKYKPDVISMDYEMPFLDGLSAVRAIMADNPRPIVMFSSMTYEGARITLDALDAGAVDFMNKNIAEVSANSALFKKKFHEKLVTFARSSNFSQTVSKSNTPLKSERVSSPFAARQGLDSVDRSSRASARSPRGALKGKVKLLVIGSSTGGPVAVADIIANLPSDFPAPILVVQHMPENFTRAFAERMDRQSALTVKEAQNGDRLDQGMVLVAPGGKQMMIDRTGSCIKIIDGDDRVNYKPCIDITFASAAAAFNQNVLAVVLTGMGADGCEGARLLKAKGSTIWSQDKESCVVYGMPAAVARENLTSCVLPLNQFAEKLTREL